VGRQIVQRFRHGWDHYPPPEGKAGQMRWGCSRAEDPEDCPCFHRLRKDLATSYYWSGQCGRDYLYFVTQWHPFLGVFLCHPNHPWTKFSRFLMLLASLAFTMVPSAAVADDFGQCTQHSPGHDENLGYWMEKFYVLIWVTIPDCFFAQVLYRLSVMPIYCWCRFCPRLFTFIARINICGVLLFGALTSVMSYTIKRDAAWACLLEPICFGKIMSWLAWFPLFLLVPCKVGFISLWRYERRRAMMDQTSQAGTAGHTAQMLQVPDEALHTEGFELTHA